MMEMSAYADESIKLKNIHVDRVLRAVEAYIRGGRAHCSCQECFLDILAMTLNRVPPRYVVNETLMDLHEARHTQLSDEAIAGHLEVAAQRVALRPRCQNDRAA